MAFSAPRCMPRCRAWGSAPVVVTGVVTNICVRSTCHDAFFLGYNVLVPEQCVAATSAREQASSLYDIDTHYGSVTSLEQVLGLLASARGRAMNDLVIRNIGRIVSGDVAQPLLAGDTVIVRDGKIAAIGQAGAVDAAGDGSCDRRGWLPALAGANQFAHPPGGRRLHAAPANARLHRKRAARRRNADHLGRRSSPAGPAQGRRRNQGAGDSGR